MFRLAVVVILSCFSVCAESARDRVIDGKDVANIQEHPYQCSLQKLENHACGCSIINNKVLVIAAHCVVGATQSDINHWQVRCGSVFWSTGGVLRKIDSILLHHNYNTDTMANDVALVKLSSPLVYSSTMKPIKLATSDPADGSPVVISGWGYKKEDVKAMAPKLQRGEVNFLSGKSCSSSLYKYLGEIKEGMCCGVGGSTDACQGDSGGPLTDVNQNLVGIVSWGYGCAKPGYPGVYSSVAHYRSWIEKNSQAML